MREKDKDPTITAGLRHYSGMHYQMYLNVKIKDVYILKKKAKHSPIFFLNRWYDHVLRQCQVNDLTIIIMNKNIRMVTRYNNKKIISIVINIFSIDQQWPIQKSNEKKRTFIQY